MGNLLYHDLDDPLVLKSLLPQLSSIATHNFVVDFNTEKSFCGINIPPDDFRSLLGSAERPYATRWINFFGWNADQKEAVGAIAEEYGFSSRLLDHLWPDNITGSSEATELHPSTQTEAPVHFAQSDVELAIKHNHEALKASADPALALPRFVSIIKNLWHFCAVESGDHYLYIGCNTLFPTITPDSSADVDPNKPSGYRVWTSLILCDDGTVISIFENPSLTSDAVSYQQVLKTVRQNAINIFRNLSRLYAPSSPDQPLGKISIRPVAFDALGASKVTAQQATEPETSATRNEQSALLLYYLFDDWIATYSRLTRSENSHRVQLERIRRHMLQNADVELVERLHVIGRQLTVLKNVYRSYGFIVKRVLYRHRTFNDRNHGSGGMAAYTDHAVPTPMNMMTGDDSGSAEDLEDGSAPSTTASIFNTTIPKPEDRVRLPLSVIFRFERLLDRIHLLALTEIEECIAEKNSLTFMVRTWTRRPKLIPNQSAFTYHTPPPSTVLLTRHPSKFLKCLPMLTSVQSHPELQSHSTR